MYSKRKTCALKTCFLMTALLFAIVSGSAGIDRETYSVRSSVAERHALLVGINKYDPSYGVSDLRFCVADAEGIRDTVLLGDAYGRWRSTDIRLLTDEQAVKTSIRAALNDLASEVGPGGLVLYYHSGHGGQTDPGVNPMDTFLCAYDTDYRDIELAEDLAKFKPSVNVVIIIDTCHSGGMFKNAAGVPEWPFVERVMAKYRVMRSAELKSKGLAIPRNLGDNIAFMTACDYDEYSWERGEHGQYTGYLLEACAIPAVDTNRDGEYQFLELHAYAKAKVLALSPPHRQHAQSYNDALLGALVARSVATHVSDGMPGLRNDYSGNGVSDLALYHETTGQWFVRTLDGGLVLWAEVWGGPGMRPVTGDYNGDGRADIAVYLEAEGRWFIRSLTKGIIAWDIQWGGPGSSPVAGDYSGNGVSDLAVYDKMSGIWNILTLDGLKAEVRSGSGSEVITVSGDYSGNGMADYALYNNYGDWRITSIAGSPIVQDIQWGGSGYYPVPGDYDGNGICDMAVYHGDTGMWYIWSHSKNELLAWGERWGGPGYVPVQGDYNGDGKADIAVYHEDTGQWFIKSLTRGVIAWGIEWGGPGLTPVQSSW